MTPEAEKRLIKHVEELTDGVEALGKALRDLTDKIERLQARLAEVERATPLSRPVTGPPVRKLPPSPRGRPDIEGRTFGDI